MCINIYKYTNVNYILMCINIYKYANVNYIYIYKYFYIIIILFTRTVSKIYKWFHIFPEEYY